MKEIICNPIFTTLVILVSAFCYLENKCCFIIDLFHSINARNSLNFALTFANLHYIVPLNFTFHKIQILLHLFSNTAQLPFWVLVYFRRKLSQSKSDSSFDQNFGKMRRCAMVSKVTEYWFLSENECICWLKSGLRIKMCINFIF